METVIIYLTLALGFSFLCSILEAVLLSTPMSFISIKESEGENVKYLKAQKSNIDRPISAILSLNTVAHTIGAAGVGAEAVKVFGEVYFGAISAVLTILILVLSEIIPKTIGATYWRRLAIPSSKIIRVLIVICFPLVWLSEFITRLITPENTEKSVSREELSAMVDVGEKEGVFETNESRIIQNLMKLEAVEVRQVMTPRSVTATASETDTVKDFYADKTLRSYSRIPLFSEESADEEEYISGYVLLRDVLSNLTEDKFDIKLQDIKRPIIAIREDENVSSAWEKLLEQKEHIALIIDEYGSFEGIITLEDIVETILGLEIIDEKDTVVDMQQLAREKWEARMAKYKQLI